MRKSSTVMLLVVLVAVSAPDAVGAMKSGSRFVLDFTKPDAVKKQAAWSPADRLDITDAGLGWDGAANAWRDAWIQTTEPIAIGRSWRPVQYARVSAEIIPAGKFIFRGEHGMEFPSGILYVRHSPDAKHWSDWQVLKYETPRDKENPKQRYHGELRIPYRERGAYANLTRQYSKMDVPWKSDEEAAVRWIVKNDPKFFEKHRPFIGYLQFLFEISLRGSRRIEKISFDVSCGAGGMHSPPRDRSVYEERDRIPGGSRRRTSRSRQRRRKRRARSVSDWTPPHARCCAATRTRRSGRGITQRRLRRASGSPARKTPHSTTCCGTGTPGSCPATGRKPSPPTVRHFPKSSAEGTPSAATVSRTGRSWSR